jgi:amidase
MQDVLKMTARQAVDLLKKKQVSPLELIEASERRVDEIDHLINALPIRCYDRARVNARKLMDSSADTILAGLPVAIKDLNRVAGVRSTWGSSLFADHVPEHSDIGVQVLERNGAVVVAKSNVPELGAGGNSNNPVFGMTRNPWNTGLTSGGSTGGGAAAVAPGEVWLANGSDSGASLRLPASFCSVATIRPTPGRVAWGSPLWRIEGPSQQPWETLKVEGPLGRTVGDVALMLDAQVGVHPRDPRAFPHDGVSFLGAVDAPRTPKRIAFTSDLGGITPVDKEVAAICQGAALKFEEMGVIVEEATPDLSDVREIYKILRALSFTSTYGSLVEKHRGKIKEHTAWNVEASGKLSAAEIARAERARADLAHRVAEFFETYDMLLCPVACTPPIKVELAALMELGEHKFENYYDWYTMTYAISLPACPCMSVPCGFTQSGLPIGLQMVGPWFSERLLLSTGRLLEDALGICGKVPVQPRVNHQ